jgi:hypothetical protein
MGALTGPRIDWEFVVFGTLLVWIFFGILIPFAILAWRSALWS